MLGLRSHTLRRNSGPLLRRLLTLLGGVVGLVRLLHGEQLLLLQVLRLSMGHLLLKMMHHIDGSHIRICLLHGSQLCGTKALSTSR